MKPENETQYFAEHIGASLQKLERTRSRSLFAYASSYMIIKISRTDKPFWGLNKKIIKYLLSIDNNFYCVFLVNKNEGWIYNKKDVLRMIQSNKWKDSKGEYKINPPLEDKLQFSSIEKFKLLAEKS